MSWAGRPSRRAPARNLDFLVEAFDADDRAVPQLPCRGRDVDRRHRLRGLPRAGAPRARRRDRERPRRGDGPDRDVPVRTRAARRDRAHRASRPGVRAPRLRGEAAGRAGRSDRGGLPPDRRSVPGPVPGAGVVAVAMAGIAGDLRERAAAPGPDRRRHRPRLEGDGRHGPQRPRLAHQRPDHRPTATSRRSATGGGIGTARRPSSTSSRSRRRRCCSRPSRRTW